nr:MAG TPA: hypothetical protein [Caudoviricetes sp.]
MLALIDKSCFYQLEKEGNPLLYFYKKYGGIQSLHHLIYS